MRSSCARSADINLKLQFILRRYRGRSIMVKVISIVFALVIANNSVAATKSLTSVLIDSDHSCKGRKWESYLKSSVRTKDGKSYIPWMPIIQKDMYKPESLEFISLINPSDIKVCGKLNFKIGKDKSDIEYPLKGLNHC